MKFVLALRGGEIYNLTLTSNRENTVLSRSKQTVTQRAVVLQFSTHCSLHILRSRLEVLLQQRVDDARDAERRLNDVGEDLLV